MADPRVVRTRWPTWTRSRSSSEVVVAHDEQTTIRDGDVFLKIDLDQTQPDLEIAAMALAPLPTPTVLWR